MDDHCQSPDDNCQPSSSSVSRWSKLKDDIDSAYDKLFYGKHKFFKTLKPHNLPKNSSIQLLGVSYTIEDCTADDFYLALHNFIWLTYRSNFEPIVHSGTYWKSDSGWGCTIRSAQMLLAKAFVMLKHCDEHADKCNFKQIIKLFEDSTGSPFGIHSLLKINAGRQDKKASTSQKNWFSPSEAISLLRDALNETSNQFSSKLTIYLSVDTKVVLEDLVALSDNWSKAVVVVICLRLGTKHINNIYYQKLRKMFSLQFMLGAIGGRPRAAVYLVASAENCLYSLDPHTTQPYQPLDVKLESKEEAKKWNSFHCERLSRIPLEDLDPSLAVSFMLRSSNELDLWMDQLESAEIIHRHLDNEADKCDHQKSVLFSIVKEKGVEMDSTDALEQEFDMDDSGFVLL